ncbi:Ribosomal RNA small subunit methyltransferase J [Legionella massiliensis]|uniref:Ribosomal RNA small subunit methyltransferase J n=1 Tax=Legionella massiliensis TaxID=1034943 RepID=A0A078L0G9_9GAMM|nr:class I SAM-dependent methyltransferase [Legionella massiliensis]CDZ77493.1 Ribosomal RNA small subunit methyltransferase J [Legionella massiliensis]CEE13231.1 Ribosomal RNA small subunit methyltransferase J [Legionella massiliensis]
MTEQLVIAYEAESLYEQAKELAESLALLIDNQAKNKLLLTADKLVLKMDSFSPLYSDFSHKTWQKRRDAGKKQGLVKACKPSPGVRIIDTTAGWGRDAAVLASFGAEVLMLERQPVIAALLRDGLARQDEQSRKNLRLDLHEADAKTYLQALSPADYPDVIYIDPMHPTRQKAALVKKDMQALQQLLGADNDAQALLEVALSRAMKRVVIKWPQHLAAILPPTTHIPGKVVRFDIYIPSNGG